jgi:hypothetical protein
MKYTFIITASLLLISCNAHTQEREIYDKLFKWRITIPKDFQIVSIEEGLELQKKGVDAIEKTYGGKVDNQTTNIFHFKSGQFNDLEANYQPFDTLQDGSYLESCKNVNEVAYETFKAQMPGTRIDSSSSVEVIDGLSFQTFKVTIIFPNKMVMTIIGFSRLFIKKDFTCFITYVDSKIGESMMNAWRNSKFEKD